MKRSYLYIIGAIILVAIAYFIWKPGPEIINIQSTGTSIVAFGDSLVRGVGSTEGRDFISALADDVGEPIINLGKSGDTTLTALERIDTIWEHNPKVVIVLLGGNDYLKRIPMTETFNNLDTIVNEIHAHGSAVLLLGVRGGLLRDTYNDAFEDFAKDHKVGFVPNVLDGLIGNKEYMSDTIHPNDLGYAKVADKVFPVLQEMLEDNRDR